MFNYGDSGGTNTPDGEKCTNCGQLATLFAMVKEPGQPTVYKYCCYKCELAWTKTEGSSCFGVNPNNLPDNWVGGDLFGMIEKGKEKGKEGGKR